MMRDWYRSHYQSVYKGHARSLRFTRIKCLRVGVCAFHPGLGNCAELSGDSPGYYIEQFREVLAVATGLHKASMMIYWCSVQTCSISLYASSAYNVPSFKSG